MLEGLIAALQEDRPGDRHHPRLAATARRPRAKLEKELKLSERQSEAILSMRLSRLTQLEAKELRDRLAELAKRIVRAGGAAGVARAADRRHPPRAGGAGGEVRRPAAHHDLREREGGPHRGHAGGGGGGRHRHARGLRQAGAHARVPARRGHAAARSSAAEYEADYLERVLVASTEDWLMAFTSRRPRLRPARARPAGHGPVARAASGCTSCWSCPRTRTSPPCTW